jgi:hypothetical protein
MIPRMSSAAAGQGRDTTSGSVQDGAGAPDVKSKPRISLNITVISTLILFGLLLIKVYGVAGFSLETAAALVAVQPASVIIGTIALYSYLFMGLLAAISIYFIFTTIALKQGLQKYFLKWLWVAFPLAAFGILLSPIRYLIDSLIELLFVLLVSWIVSRLAAWRAAKKSRRAAKAAWRLGKGKKPPGLWAARSWKPGNLLAGTFHRTAGCLTAVIIMLFFLGTISQPWVPAEIISLKQPIAANLTVPPPYQPTRYPVVFILGDADGRVELLFDSDRDVVYTNQSNILSQRICNLNDEPAGFPPLLERLLHESFKPHVISCWRCTDQNIERQKENAPFFIAWLEWAWNQEPAPHNPVATHKQCTETAKPPGGHRQRIAPITPSGGGVAHA